MNETIVEETGWSRLAMLIEGKASIFVVNDSSGSRPRHRIVLKIYVMPHLAPFLLDWLKSRGVKVESFQLQAKGGKATQYWVRLVDAEVGRVLAECHGYLLSDLRKRQARLVFDFFKTRQRPGIHLLAEERQIREAVVKQLAELSKAAG